METAVFSPLCVDLPVKIPKRHAGDIGDAAHLKSKMGVVSSMKVIGTKCKCLVVKQLIVRAEWTPLSAARTPCVMEERDERKSTALSRLGSGGKVFEFSPCACGDGIDQN